MISDSERREAAANLRGMTEEELCCMFLGEILDCAIGGRCLDDEGDIDERLILNRLADLIDRPTCDVRMGVTGHVGVCTRCGAMVEMRAAVFDALEALPTRYCPNCGAEVVS